MKSLVIVESGAKAKKIKGYLDSNFPDNDWQVEACVGHVRDLPDKENAVDPRDWTNLKWEFSSKGKKVMRELRKFCKDSDILFLATDPDREGEAIAWHLLSDFDQKKLTDGLEVKRVTFNEITSSAIKRAIESPRELDKGLSRRLSCKTYIRSLNRFQGIAASMEAHFKSEISWQSSISNPQNTLRKGRSERCACSRGVLAF